MAKAPHKAVQAIPHWENDKMGKENENGHAQRVPTFYTSCASYL